MKKVWIVLFVCILLSCQLDKLQSKYEKNPREILSLASWNVQTFFDATEHGYEYADFIGKNSSWSEEKYDQRLKNIARQLKSINTDIIALQEVENEAVMQDILNYSPKDFPFKYAGFARQDEKSVFGCGIFSRFPILAIKAHQLNVTYANLGTVPAMRPLVEAEIQYGNKDEILIVIICHWKSKSGGAEKTAIWREQQQALLAGIVENIQAKRPAIPIIALGDFNTDIAEFTFVDTEIIELSNQKTKIRFFTPWTSYLAEHTNGTYYYNKSWERIDHIFLAQSTVTQAEQQTNSLQNQQFVLEKFTIHTENDFTNKYQTPNRYDIRSGTGSSDHLPISASLIRTQN